MFKTIITRTLPRVATRSAPRVATRSAMFSSPRVAFAVAASALTITGLALAQPAYPVVNEMPTETVVDSAIDPFPLHISPNEFLPLDWQLIGTGVRSVTFVNFKVYGVGLYVASEDANKTRDLLGNASLDDLLDPVANVPIIDKLLDGGVKFLVRFSPVRNTDFNHLKDGFIKLILANPKAKAHRETIGNGLEELRDVFAANRGAVPKNHVLYLIQHADGGLQFVYENTNKHTSKVMGKVKEPLVAKVLLSSYMAGPKPLSKPLQQSVAAGLAQI